jgi:hypothetical protein
MLIWSFVAPDPEATQLLLPWMYAMVDGVRLDRRVSPVVKREKTPKEHSANDVY